MDVVSLLPAATEICYALGVEPVGVSHECDHPPAAADVPAMTVSVVDGDGASTTIDEAVATADREGNGVYTIDRETLASVGPDLVITQGTCDVCAIDRVLVEAAISDLGLDTEVLTLDPHSITDVFAAVDRIGAATGRESRAETLVDDLRAHVERVRERVAGRERRPRVAVLDWMDPVMVAGHWIPEMVEVAGGSYGLTDAGARSRPREWRELLAYDPEVLVVAPCGFELAQTTEHIEELTEREGWADLTAVARGRAYLMDGHNYVNRPGPRLVDTLEYLAALIQPGAVEVPPADVVRPARSAAADAD